MPARRVAGCGGQTGLQITLGELQAPMDHTISGSSLKHMALPAPTWISWDAFMRPTYPIRTFSAWMRANRNCAPIICLAGERAATLWVAATIFGQAAGSIRISGA